MPRYQIPVNGVARVLDVDGDMPLLWVLRDELQLKGTKFGCGAAFAARARCISTGRRCAAAKCRSRARPGGAFDDHRGLAAHGGQPLQAAWIGHDVPQCGYCQAGQIMPATALLAHTPTPTDADIDAAMAGNLCRCGTFLRIRAAIKDAAGTGAGT